MQWGFGLPMIHKEGHMIRLLTEVTLISFFLSGCAFSTQIPTSQSSGLEQLLATRSLERAVSELDLRQFAGRRVWTDMNILAKDNKQGGFLAESGYVNSFLTAELEKAGAKVAVTKDEADLYLKIFLSVLGIDSAQWLLGLPSMPVPPTGMTLPEIALLKSSRSSGYGEIKIYAFDSRTGELMGKEALIGTGKANYDRYVVLLFLGFTHTDIFEEVPDK